VGERIRQIEDQAGRKIDDVAKALLRYQVVRGPAKRLANSRLAWHVATRIDRIRARRLQAIIRKAPVPHHVGVIMDGNRRFAKLMGLGDVSMGHVAGQERLENVLDWCLDLGIRVLTVYAFSTENFQRAAPERDLLMELFEHNFRKMSVDERVHKNKIRVRAIGDLSMLPAPVQEAAKAAMEATKAYDQYSFNVAIAYGGRQEIVDAVRSLAQDARSGVLDPNAITAETISRRLYTGELPDPDFIIRTSGEERLSNFLLWQVAYSELYFSDVNWPELNKLEFLRAIQEYQRRKRRFGN
jgi:tritrans,polycis-undecaprenyl-diphosphate synthase [geranylgeranyl-diphosphate specific]